MDTILRSLVPTPDNYLPKAIVFPNSSYFAGKDVWADKIVGNWEGWKWSF